MPRTKKITKDEEKVATSAKIYEGSVLIREYSLEVHGEDFNKLAEQYVAGHPNCVIKNA